MKSAHAIGGLFLFVAMATSLGGHQPHTVASINHDEFQINGKPTYAGRYWNGLKIEGLLLNSRMVQGIFDDQNTNTVSKWAYPDTHKWDPDRNTREFVAAMPEWRKCGLLSFTINLQGGSPEGYSREQPWNNSAFAADGSLRADYMKRLELILNQADDLGMIVILGYFYFGQDERLRDEDAVIRATDNTTQWIVDHGYCNVLIEINNECNEGRYDHAILKPERVHELIARVKKITAGNHSLLASTSYRGGTIPDESVLRVADFVLIHGNTVSNPDEISKMVRKVRGTPGYRGVPILFNEDDHYNFDQPFNNFTAAVREHASWGYFDYRMKGEGFDDGYQSLPVNWGINSARKRSFFKLLSEMTAEKK